MQTKKKFDAVTFMREARERLANEWKQKSRREEICYLSKKYGRLVKGKRRREVA